MDASEARFHEEMIGVYKQAKRECNYNATYFLQMVAEMGGVLAAKKLLDSPDISHGLIALWNCGRLELSMEALVLQPEWQPLFTAEELAVAKKRLTDLGYFGGEGSQR